jgi:hypothetical protein
MNKQIYLGGTPLIDLSGYATESYVDTAVENVDVTDQLENYVLKTTLDASYGVLDASIKNTDASIAAIKTTLADITTDGATDTVINTWAEMKAFLADYSTASDLSTLINTVKTDAVNDASADAASKYQPIGDYVTEADLSGYVNADDVAAAINSSIAALDLANTYQAKGNYLVANDISTFVDADAVSAQINSSIAALDLANTYQAKGDYASDASLAALDASVAANYETKNDSSAHINGAGVTNVVHCTAAEYAAIENKSATTLYIVTD